MDPDRAMMPVDVPGSRAIFVNENSGFDPDYLAQRPANRRRRRAGEPGDRGASVLTAVLTDGPGTGQHSPAPLAGISRSQAEQASPPITSRHPGSRL